MTPRVDQFLPILIGRDAVGRHVLAVDDLLAAAGVDTRIYAGSTEPALAGRARPMSEWRPDPGAVSLYHLATGSPIADELVERAPRLGLAHHNITPPHHFARWSAEMAQQTAWGRRQMRALARSAVHGIGDSAFNARELADAGCASTAVAPILLDPTTFDRGDHMAVGRSAAPTGGDGGARWLFVGRLAPNKAQHDVIRAFDAYRRCYDPSAELRLVGIASPPSYEQALRRLVTELGLDDAVAFTGSVSDAELGAHYRSADVFVCLSRHEGFCVPILEAFHHRLPVVAMRSSAVTETVGSGGVLLDSAEPLLVAAAAHVVVADASARDAVVARGTRRLDDFEIGRSSAALLAAGEPLWGRPA